MAIITDRHVSIYQTTISAVRDALGRNATIYLAPTQVECVYCILDPVRNVSSGITASGYDWTTHDDYVSPYNDKVCPECQGIGYTETANTVTVQGTSKNLDYNDTDDKNIGVFKPGDIRFSCDLADALVDSSDVNGETYFDRARSVTFDGVNYKVVNTSKSGLRDLYTLRVIMERTNK